MSMKNNDQDYSISCVIPAYNREGMIAEAINSVLSQTFMPDEIIVIDDGSTDDTYLIASRFGGIVRVVKTKNAGASAARNCGAEEAKSKWIAWLDSDDTWYPDYLNKIVMAMKQTECKAKLYFANLCLDSEQYTRDKLWDTSDIKFDHNLEFLFFDHGADLLLNGPHIVMLQAAVMERSTFFDLGGFWCELNVHEDTHIFLKFFHTKPLCAVNVLGAKMSSDADQRLSRDKGYKHNYCAWKMWDDIGRNIPNLSRLWLIKVLDRKGRHLYALWKDNTSNDKLRVRLWRLSLGIYCKVYAKLKKCL